MKQFDHLRELCQDFSLAISIRDRSSNQGGEKLDTLIHGAGAIAIALAFLLFTGDPTMALVIIAFWGGVLPDLIPNTPMYLRLWIQNKRWPGTAQDWSGYQIKMPRLYQIYILSHSLLISLVIIGVELFTIHLTHWYSVPVFGLGWLLHAFLDIPTHAGEFNTRFLWPSKWEYQGGSNAWVWPIKLKMITWAIHLAIIVALLALQ